MRAPPEHETIIKADLAAIAYSIARVIFSPTTEPMEPPMKLPSIAEITIRKAVQMPVSADYGFIDADLSRQAVETLLIVFGRP